MISETQMTTLNRKMFDSRKNSREIHRLGYIAPITLQYHDKGEFDHIFMTSRPTILKPYFLVFVFSFLSKPAVTDLTHTKSLLKLNEREQQWRLLVLNNIGATRHHWR